MINLYPNEQRHTKSRIKIKENGAVTLVITLILIMITTLIIIFAAKFGIMQSKITANTKRHYQALAAAEAGLEFGISYLKNNSNTILANPSSGYITAYSDGNTTNVTLNNNSKFTVVYTNPVANNYNLITITSTGTSDDGSATRVLSQKVQYGSIFMNPASTGLTSKGSVSLGGSGRVINTITNQTIASASTVSLSGNSSTTTSSGGSTAGNVQSDVTQNSSSLSSMSQTDFIANYFGTRLTDTLKNNMTYYNNSTNTNYSSNLNNLTNAAVWIDQTNGSTATLNGNTTIGSASNPVLLIVNGSLTISGNLNFYGFIFVIGTSGITTLTGNIKIYGGMATTDNLNIGGSSTLTYDSSVLNSLKNSSVLSYWAKVPGSWKDF